MHKPIEIPAPDTVIEDVLEELEIVLKHSADAETEASYWLDNPGHDDPSLEDLTALAFITIDNPDSRDLDQALHIDQTADGYRVRYALADAAYYVRPGSALFDEALQRGATFYTPLIAAPMLPTRLSEGLVSLNPEVPRRALVFDIQLNDDASLQKTGVVRALIRSRAKLSYGGVQDWLDSHCGLEASESERAIMNCSVETVHKSSNQHTVDPLDADVPYKQTLMLLQHVGEKLISISAQRGVVPFDRSETSISVNSNTGSFEVGRRHRYMTEQYNEQISLLCNMQGAELLMALQGHSDALQAVYRVHAAPLSKNSKSLKNTLDQLVDTHSLDDRWRWQEGESLAQYVRKLPTDATSSRLKSTIQRQIMRAQRASVFQPEPDIHHALKAAAYARFSSPMREIVGIFTHKELLESLTIDQPTLSTLDDQLLRGKVIKAANTARQTQRKLDKKIQFSVIQSVLNTNISTDNKKLYTATIIGLRHDRLYASIDGLALDFKIYRDDLDEQFNTRYEISGTKAVPADQNQPIWLLGQGIALSARAYNRERKRFLFEIRST